MLGLRVNNQVIDLGDDISISWELRNPMFFEAGSRSYPFKLPSTLWNKKLLGFRHRIEGQNSPYDEIPVDISFNNIDIFHGTMKFRVLNDRYYEATVYDREGDFYYKAKNTRLRQVNFGEMEFSTVASALAYINNTLTLNYPDVQFGFPKLYNPSYFDPVTEDAEQRFYNNTYDDGLIHELTTLGNRTVIVPFLYFRHVLKTVLDSFGYEVRDFVFSDNEDFNSLLIYNSLSCNNLCEDFSYSLTHLFFNLHLPDLTILEFITSIESFFNCRFFINDITRVIRIVGLNTVVTDPNAVEFSKGIVSRSIELDDKISGYKLTIPVDSSDGGIQKWSDFQDFYLKNMRSAVSTIPDLPPWPFSMVGDIRFVFSESKYYFFNTSKSWVVDNDATKYLFSVLFIQNQDERTKNIELKLAALKGGDPQNWPLYIMANCGNQKKDWKDITFRICFKTIVDNGPAAPDYIATDISSSMYLWFNDANNMYEVFHKDYLSFLQTSRVVKVQKLFTVKDLRDFYFPCKYRIFDDNYILRRVQLTLKKNQISPAMIECLSVL